MKTATQHTAYVCPGHDNDPDYNWNCQFCEGGLGACSVCGAFEGATTTHCPGLAYGDIVWDEVYIGTLDFRWGRWIDRPSRHSPAWWRKHRDRLGLIDNWQGRTDIFGRKVKR